MKILIAPDKFKHSLSSVDVCDAIKKGFLQVSTDFFITTIPLADGGDGLSEVVPHYLSATKHTARVLDPLFRPVESSYLISEDGKTAFIEMAKASGLQLLEKADRNPLNTTTYGTGQLILEAITKGVKNIILGIGGSATNDGGIGMAAALGYKFKGDGKELSPIGGNLRGITEIDSSGVQNLKEISIQVACDVTNPLTGPNGASHIYAPQKGADAQMVDALEAGMRNYMSVVKRDLNIDLDDVPGAGAAGGLGAGCLAFLKAELVSGIDLVLQYSNAENLVAEADLVITGEGKIDHQSLNGKVLSGISQLCQKHGKPLIALCGVLELSDDELKEAGVARAFSVMQFAKTAEESHSQASRILTEMSEAFANGLINSK